MGRHPNQPLRGLTEPEKAEMARIAESGETVARRILKRLEFHYTPKHGSW